VPLLRVCPPPALRFYVSGWTDFLSDIAVFWVNIRSATLMGLVWALVGLAGPSQDWLGTGWRTERDWLGPGVALAGVLVPRRRRPAGTWSGLARSGSGLAGVLARTGWDWLSHPVPSLSQERTPTTPSRAFYDTRRASPQPLRFLVFWVLHGIGERRKLHARLGGTALTLRLALLRLG